MHIQGLRITHIVGPPHALNQLATSHHTTHIAQKNLQELKLLQRHRNLFTINRHHMAVNVHTHRAALQHRLSSRISLRRTTTQHRADTSNQLTRRIRLRHIVISAQFQTEHLIQLRILSGQHDNRDRRHLTQLTAHLHTGHARKHHIQQHQIRALAVKHRQSIQTVVHNNRLETLTTQQKRKGIREGLFVLNNQNFRHQ